MSFHLSLKTKQPPQPASNTLQMQNQKKQRPPNPPKEEVHRKQQLNKKTETKQNNLPLQTGVNRKRIFPTGSPRDIFLHVQPEKLQSAKEELAKLVGAKGLVVETVDMVEDGWFGSGTPSKAFLERAGNLMVVPLGWETVWFSNPEGRKLSFLGQHGGLNSDEMLVPFAVANLESLKR